MIIFVVVVKAAKLEILDARVSSCLIIINIGQYFMLIKIIFNSNLSNTFYVRSTNSFVLISILRNGSFPYSSKDRFKS